MSASTTMELWDAFKETDPAHTKPFNRAGGFKGTAIKPIYMIRRMTERFGPAGKGWGMHPPSFQVVEAGGEILVYCTASLWWEKPEQVVHGVGGDKVLAKRRSGDDFTDDEAFKKAFTDALANAMKYLGMGADVHMGQFDDDKYVAAQRRKHADADSARGPGTPPAGPLTPEPDPEATDTDGHPRDKWFADAMAFLNTVDRLDLLKTWWTGDVVQGAVKTLTPKQYVELARAKDKAKADLTKLEGARI